LGGGLFESRVVLYTFNWPALSRKEDFAP
jgi:hypothetical protein